MEKLLILSTGTNVSKEDNDEKELDGLVKPLHTPLLTFLHAVALQQEVCEKNHSYFCLDSNLIPPSLVVHLPAEQCTGRLPFWQGESFPLQTY